MIDFHSGVPLVRQVVDLLRKRVQSGEWQPGARLPAEADLAHEYEVGIRTLRDALAALRAEGIIRGGGRGQRAMVPVKVERKSVPLKPGEYVESRMPTPAERARFDVAEGVPVLVVHSTDGDKIFPADRYFVRAAWPTNNSTSNAK